MCIVVLTLSCWLEQKEFYMQYMLKFFFFHALKDMLQYEI